jgi:ribosomal protein S18 acetylase RimI-like enzyme
MREGEEEAVLAVVNEGFADHWDFRPVDRGWLDRTEPGLLVLGAADGEIAGVARCTSDRFGLGWVNSIAVLPPWRRRGLGLALLHAAFGALYDRGRRTIGLGVDAANPTGAVALYERAGMRVAWQADIWEKPAGA